MIKRTNPKRFSGLDIYQFLSSILQLIKHKNVRFIELSHYDNRYNSEVDFP